MTERSDNVPVAAAHLREGRLVAIPTETVYGMGGNGFVPEAVKAIFRVKNRPFYDPLILHTDSARKITDWGMQIPLLLQPLAEAFWPGPLTLLIPRSSDVPELITAGLGRVAVRIPNHGLTLSLLRELDFPVAAPSANPFGYVSPTRAEHVLKHFDGQIAMVLDGGPCEVGIESTIVGEEHGTIIVYRLGGLSVEEIEAVVGRVEIRTSSSKPSAPGMLVRHYSPDKQVIAVDTQQQLEAVQPEGSAYILHTLQVSQEKSASSIRLCLDERHEQAARQFYDALRAWDDDKRISRIVVERMSDFGLGRAINDRLKRAASAGSE